MGSWLPWWIIIAPAVFILVDSIMSPKTSSMGKGSATTTR